MALTEIDATKPVDGVASVKSDLRGNLAIAKYKAAEARSLTDFGAVMNGATNDTAAWNDAIAWLASSSGSGRVLRVHGTTLFTPSSLNWKLGNPNQLFVGTQDVSNCTIEVEGELRVTSTLRLPRNLTILGRAGSSGIQFSNGRSCQINRSGTFTGPVVQLSGGEGLYNRLENVTIGSNPNGPNLRIGYTGDEPGFGLDPEPPNNGNGGGQTYSVWLKNIGCYCDQTGQSAVEIFNCFWIWIRDFTFMADTPAYTSVRIGGNGVPFATRNTAGLVHFENGVVAGHAFMFDRSYQAGGGTESFFSFRNIHYETCRSPFLNMKQTGGGTVSQILLENIEAADAIGGSNLSLLYIDPVCNTRFASVFFRMCPAIYMPGIAGKISHIQGIQWDGGGHGIYDMGLIPVIPNTDNDVYPRGSVISYNGTVAAQPAFAPSNLAPAFVPNGFVVATPATLSGVTILEGTGSIATGQLAPDGSSTAITVNFTNSGSDGRTSALADTGIALLNGDLLVWGMFVRYISGGPAAPTLFANTNGGTTGGFEENGGFTRHARAGASSFGFSGWHCLWEVTRYVASGATQQAILYGMVSALAPSTPASFKLWAPFLVRVPAALGWRRQDVIAWASNLIGPPQAGGSGVQAQIPTHTFRTGSGPTGSRPSASAVGAGAQWFDTTLNRPIWSTGSTWVVGTAT